MFYLTAGTVELVSSILFFSFIIGLALYPMFYIVMKYLYPKYYWIMALTSAELIEKICCEQTEFKRHFIGPLWYFTINLGWILIIGLLGVMAEVSAFSWTAFIMTEISFHWSALRRMYLPIWFGAKPKW